MKKIIFLFLLTSLVAVSCQASPKTKILGIEREVWETTMKELPRVPSEDFLDKLLEREKELR